MLQTDATSHYQKGLNMKRRSFFKAGLFGAAGAAVSCTGKPTSTGKKELFSFIHYSDIHVQPERGAADGFLAAIEKMNSLNPDFAVSGGDLVMDVLEADEARATVLYDLYDNSCGKFDMPIYNVMGNHEVFGIRVPGRVPVDHPDWGKELFKRRFGDGATYRSFDHKGVHFVLLDSIGIVPSQDGTAFDYIGEIGSDQLTWLERDIAGLPAETPVIGVTHIPLFSLYQQVTNGPLAQWGRGGVINDGKQLYDILSGHNVLGVLEGHIHVNELYEYKGTRFVDTAAVSGAWWGGARDGHPEGFNLVHVYEDEIVCEYVTYGWDASKYAV